MYKSTQEQARNCLSCDKPLKGRSDKKFCDDYCRNNFNNHLKGEEGPLVRSINKILRKNRKLLEALIQPDERTAKSLKGILIERGFDFRYFTNLFTNKKGFTYFFCYEYGYLLLEGEWVLIVKLKGA